MATRREALGAVLLAAPMLAMHEAAAQAPQAAAQPKPEPPPAATKLFAVEFRTGPAWDTALKPHEQPHFNDHSANLKRLRDAGMILLGARYSDKGFLVFSAVSEAAVRAEIDPDPTVKAGVFAYEVHAFNVFYPGCVPTAARAAS
jgi:hypothetical protein